MKAREQEQPEKIGSKIIRHVYRLPIDEKDKVAVEIDGTRYEVINLEVKGAGILVGEDGAISIGRRLEAIVLDLDAGQILLQGRVIHISPRDFQLICGIEFVNVSRENEEILINFLRRQRDSLFHGK